MDAVLSGHAGVALLLNGEVLSSIHFDGEEEALPRSPADVRLLFAGARDLRLLRDVDLAEVRRQLNQECTNVDALHLTLILLDDELSHETRRTAAEELEELLANDSITRWVESVLYAHPLPRSADLAGASTACAGLSNHIRVFFPRLESYQAVITEVQQAWEEIPSSFFGSAEDRSRALSIAVREGFFRDLVAILVSGRGVEEFLSRANNNILFREIDSVERRILTEWAANLQVSRLHGGKTFLWTAEEGGVDSGARQSLSIGSADLDSSSGIHGILHRSSEERTEDLFRWFQRRVLTFFLRRGFSLDESRDLAHETFLQIYRHIDAFRGGISVETWIFNIAARLCMMNLRGQSALKVSLDYGVPEPLSPKEEEAEVALDAIPEERARLLQKALEELPPQMRMAVRLRMDGDLKYGEIADEMHVSIETVKAHLYQAREHLRKKLREYFTDIEL